MSHEEKITWALGVLAPLGFLAYLIAAFAVGDGPLDADTYVWPMVGSILGAIVVGILASIVIGILSPKEAGKADQRDREISWFGSRVGHSFVVIGGMAALVMCFVAAPHVWIANVLYVAFLLSALLETGAKLVAYRRGF